MASSMTSSLRRRCACPSLPSALVALLLVVVLLACSVAADNNTASTTTSAGGGASNNANGGAPFFGRRTAYVTDWHSGYQGREGREFLYGVETLVATLREKTNARSDIVVLVADDAPRPVFAALAALHVVVKTVPPLLAVPKHALALPTAPRSDEKSVCEGTFMRMHAWTLVEYDRVIYMSADTLVVHSVDELFGCGRFCMPFTTWHMKDSAFFVLQPDMDMFHKLVYRFENFALPGTKHGNRVGRWCTRLLLLTFIFCYSL
jgi:hypothetical protein